MAPARRRRDLVRGGIALGYVLIPLAVGFLLDFQVEGVQPLIGLGDYIGFVTLFLLAFGIALQFPVILTCSPASASSATPSSRAGVDT